MLRISIGALAGMVSLGVVDTSCAEDRLDRLSGLIGWDSPSCSDDRVVGRLEAEGKKALTIGVLCEETAWRRLFSSDLVALDRGCNAMEASLLTHLVSILADPDKSEITCADGLSLIETSNKAFGDAVANAEQELLLDELGESFTDEQEKPSFDEMLNSLSDDEAPAPLKGLLPRTITDAIKQKVERNWSVPAGVLDAGELVVTLRIQLAPDGSVRRVEIVDDGVGANYRTMAESARRAVLKASPFDALARYVDKYEGWRVITMTFSPPV